MLIAILILLILIFLSCILLLLKTSNKENRGQEISDSLDKNFARAREESASSARNTREEILQMFDKLAQMQNKKLEEFARQLHVFEEKFMKNSVQNRDEQSRNLKEFEQSQKQKFDEFFLKNNQMRLEIENKLDGIRVVVENKLQFLQEDNSKKLEQMRLTVDEKLQETLEKRFNQSFKLIGDQLTQVQKGFGEMQNLANGVGDLKKVLANVKTRGNIGEIQLGAILEQFFSPAQYEQNFAVKPEGSQRVEFAIKIPSKERDDDFIFLPIDSKFPIEDYQRLNDLYENFDASNQQFTKSAIDQAKRQFESAVKKAAKDIHDKYLNPPKTTDFGIMFVPTEGLYAEILRSSNLFDDLQKNFRVIVLGPTTIVAFLSALQMGFRTLAIEKKSSDVWKILGAVKTEFGKFGDLLEKTRKKITETGNVIDDAARKSRAIERQLRDVDSLPQGESAGQIGFIEDLMKDEE